MPLDPKASREQVIDELMASYHGTGKIGNTRPRSAAHARLIAVAAAHEHARSQHRQPRD